MFDWSCILTVMFEIKVLQFDFVYFGLEMEPKVGINIVKRSSGFPMTLA